MKTLIKLLWSLMIDKGLNKASDEKFEKRMGTCRTNSCKSYKKPFGVKALEKCTSCGCFLNVKARIDEFYIECPKKLW